MSNSAAQRGILNLGMANKGYKALLSTARSDTERKILWSYVNATERRMNQKVGTGKFASVSG